MRRSLVMSEGETQSSSSSSRPGQKLSQSFSREKLSSTMSQPRGPSIGSTDNESFLNPTDRNYAHQVLLSAEERNEVTRHAPSKSTFRPLPNRDETDQLADQGHRSKSHKYLMEASNSSGAKRDNNDVDDDDIDDEGRGNHPSELTTESLKKLRHQNQEILREHITISFFTLRFSNEKLEKEFFTTRIERMANATRYTIINLIFIHSLFAYKSAVDMRWSTSDTAAMVIHLLSIGIFAKTLLTPQDKLFRSLSNHSAFVVFSCYSIIIPRALSGAVGRSDMSISMGEDDLGYLFCCTLAILFLMGTPFFVSVQIVMVSVIFAIIVLLVNPEPALLSKASIARLHAQALETMMEAAADVSDNGTLTASAIPLVERCQAPDAARLAEIIAFLCLFAWLTIVLLRENESQLRRNFRLTKRLAAEHIVVQIDMTNIGLFSKGAASVAPSGSYSSAPGALADTLVDSKDIRKQELIGAGSFGEVFKGTWKGTDVAIKQLHAEVEDSVLARFGAEVATMSKLRHPNIVMFLGFSPIPPLIMMEYMPRSSLDCVLHVNQTNIDPSLRLRFMHDTARGINFLHLNNPSILHLDLKSANILVDLDWRCKVCDFGLSALRRETAHAIEKQGSFTLGRTMESAPAPEIFVNGSLPWAAPETITGSAAPTEKSDIYSFGVLLFETLTSKRPFSGIDRDAVPLMVLSGARPDSRIDLATCSAVKDEKTRRMWTSLMRRCWAEDPAVRPKSTQVVKELQKIVDEAFGEDAQVWQDRVVLPGKASEEVSQPGNSNVFNIDADHLTVGKRIGGGSYGEVFEGTYFGTKVAVKQLFTTSVSTDATAEFNKECELMLQMRHPNIVLFMGSFCEPKRLLLVTELLERGSLHHVYTSQKRRAWNKHVAWVARLAADMAKGLNYLHMRSPPIIHRDMKSPNVLIDQNWTGKIGDFGLSKIKEEGTALTSVGSPLWCAPEILRGDPFGMPCDVYSFGVVLWEVLAWSEPYPSMGSVEVMKGVAFNGLRPTPPKRSPTYLVNLLEACWRDDPDERPTFAQVLEMLDRGSVSEDGDFKRSMNGDGDGSDEKGKHPTEEDDHGETAMMTKEKEKKKKEIENDEESSEEKASLDVVVVPDSATQSN